LAIGLLLAKARHTRQFTALNLSRGRGALHCTGSFSVGLNHQLGVRHAVIESRHAAAGNNPRAGCQHRSPADASDDAASSADILYELCYPRILGKQRRAFCTTWNEDAHIVLGLGFRYRKMQP
jgi:hypothetical protein